MNQKKDINSPEKSIKTDAKSSVKLPHHLEYFKNLNQQLENKSLSEQNNVLK